MRRPAQPRLFAEPAAPASADAKARTPSSRPLKYRRDFRAHDAANREAAIVILSDPVKYEGIQVEWANLVMEKNR